MPFWEMAGSTQAQQLAECNHHEICHLKITKCSWNYRCWKYKLRLKVGIAPNHGWKLESQLGIEKWNRCWELQSKLSIENLNCQLKVEIVVGRWNSDCVLEAEITNRCWKVEPQLKGERCDHSRNFPWKFRKACVKPIIPVGHRIF